MRSAADRINLAATGKNPWCRELMIGKNYLKDLCSGRFAFSCIMPAEEK